MSNTLFRKGLVAAAIVALGSAGVSAVPAQAASVLFAPTTGTGNTVIGGETFSLTASLSSDLPAANSTQLKFKVTNTTGVAATVKVNGKTIENGATLATTKAGNVALDASVGGATALTADWASAPTAGASKVFAIGTLGDGTNTVAASASTATNPTSVTIAAGSTTAAADFTVTAWLDANNNGLVDNGEISAAQDVHFIKLADAGVTTTFTKPTIDDTKFKATVAFASAVNAAQANQGGAFTVALGKYVSGTKTTATANTTYTPVAGEATTFDSANNNLKVYVSAADGATNNLDTLGKFVAGSVYSAQAVYGAALVGNEAQQTPAAAQADEISTPALTVGDNVKTSVLGYSVRAGVLSQTLTGSVKNTVNSVAHTAVGAGVPVTVTVTGLTLAGTTPETLTVAGSSVTAANYSTFSATVLTAADGSYSIPVVASAGTDGDSVTIVAKVAGVTATTGVQVAWLASSVTTLANLAVNSNTGTPAVAAVLKGGVVNASYALKDNFGAPVTATGYRLAVSALGTGASATTFYAQPLFVNGIATVAITDGSTAAGAVTANLTVQKYDANAANWGTATTVVTGASAGATTLGYSVVATLQAATAVTAVAGTNTALTATAFVTGNTNTGNAVVAPTYKDGNPIGVGAPFTIANNTISGVVTDVYGAAIPGATVKIAAAGGILFGAAGVYATDSITVVANSVGGYSVNVWSHKAGKVTYTVTTGAASKTVDVTYDAAFNTTGKTLTITAPATAQPGSTVSFSVLLTDVYGNPLAVPGGSTAAAISVKATGVGVTTYVTGTSATDATGVSTGYVTTGSADNGTITITATYNFDGNTAATAPVTATATVKVAAAAAAKNTVAVATSQAQVGAAVDVTATAVDAAGKPAAGVVVSFTNAGQGYLSNASATTDAKGVATVKLVSNVAGMNTVSAAANGVATAATAAVTFGNADANLTFSSKNRRATATYEFAGNAKVVISVNGVRVKTLYPADDMVGSYSVSLKKGKNKVSVSVAGVTADNVTVTTK